MVFPRMPNSGENGVAGLKEISSAKLSGSVSNRLVVWTERSWTYLGFTFRWDGMTWMPWFSESKAKCELPMNLL
jgi:hypothetical protein